MSEPTQTPAHVPHPSPGAGSALGVVVLLIIVATTFLVISASEDLVSSGEARAAEIAREMVERGNFVLPSLNYEVSAHSMTKPPLFHWLLIASGYPQEWANFAIHLPPALAALGCIYLVYLLGARMFDARAGVYGALVLASSVQFLTAGATARIDILFTLLILGAITGFYYAVTSPPGQRRAVYVFYLCTGLAVLSKGPAGLFLPVFTAVLYLWSTGQLKLLRELRPGRGMLLMLAVALPWYVAVAVTAPPELVHNFFFGQLAHWWAGGTKEAGKAAKAFWYYVPYLLFGLFPWSLFVPGALIYAVAELRRQRRHPVLLLLIWFFGGLVVFSLGGKKAARYLLPMLPAAAVLMGYYWGGLVQAAGSAHRRVHLASAAVVLAVMVLVLGGFVWGFLNPEVTLARLVEGRNAGDTAGLTAAWGYLLEHRSATLAVVTLITVLGLLATVGFARRRIAAGSVATAGMAWVGLLSFALWISPYLVAAKSPRAIATELRELVPEDAALYVGGTAYKHALRWYLARRITMVGPAQALPDRVREATADWILIMSKRPLPAEVLGARDGVRQWAVDYYTVTLFPPVPGP